MNEDDTFNKLRRLPFDDALTLFFNKIGGMYTDEELELEWDTKHRKSTG